MVTSEPRTTPEQRAALRERLALAQPAPWVADSGRYTDPDTGRLYTYTTGIRPILVNMLWVGPEHQPAYNVEAIADLRNAADALLADADALAAATAEVARLRDRCEMALRCLNEGRPYGAKGALLQALAPQQGDGNRE